MAQLTTLIKDGKPLPDEFVRDVCKAWAKRRAKPETEIVMNILDRIFTQEGYSGTKGQMILPVEFLDILRSALRQGGQDEESRRLQGGNGLNWISGVADTLRPLGWVEMSEKAGLCVLKEWKGQL